MHAAALLWHSKSVAKVRSCPKKLEFNFQGRPQQSELSSRQYAYLMIWSKLLIVDSCQPQQSQAESVQQNCWWHHESHPNHLHTSCFPEKSTGATQYTHTSTVYWVRASFNRKKVEHMTGYICKGVWRCVCRGVCHEGCPIDYEVVSLLDKSVFEYKKGRAHDRQYLQRCVEVCVISRGAACSGAGPGCL